MMVVVAVALLNDSGQILLSQRRANQSFPGAYDFRFLLPPMLCPFQRLPMQWVFCGVLLTLT